MNLLTSQDGRYKIIKPEGRHFPRATGVSPSRQKLTAVSCRIPLLLLIGLQEEGSRLACYPVTLKFFCSSGRNPCSGNQGSFQPSQFPGEWRIRTAASSESSLLRLVAGSGALGVKNHYKNLPSPLWQMNPPSQLYTFYRISILTD